ncbi:CHASE2 domain-containing protein [Stutzerimonas nitrititolerans]|uniref:CHASE2 domain-containing protein n=1 Tax=Stutzerimonas nitrititolerans TaxID=2482751 RepID=UPI00026D675C|nr:CHASE2 domain-containing protein [Stutzerimonas nitrititolerans]AFN77070.1 CHASE2 domain protein [Stutzerimonas stutzeri DSM 10701]MBT1121295.1 CHASE2 domain-containing protein [Stutzerimonas nitrititolerans]
MPAFLRKFSLLAGLGGLIVILLDPFGLTSATDAASARLLNQLLANGYDEGARQRIAVVLIDDDYLRQRDSHWPLPYAEQSKLFRQLLAYRPAAVMVDLMYSYDHSQGRGNDSSQLLSNVFERYQDAAIPLYLASMGTADIPTLSELAAASQPALVSWSGYQDQYPLAAETNIGWMDSAAFALYRAHCRRHACGPLPETPILAGAEPPMALQWGRGLPREQRHVSDMSEHTAEHGAWRQALEQVLQAIFWRISRPAETLHPYHLTITASTLATTVPEEKDLLRELLADRLVLVGADIASAKDRTLSPVHGQLPGVYAHAMALDNLLQYGMDYFSTPPTVFDTEIDVLDLFEMAFVLFVLWFQSRSRRGIAIPLCAVALLFALSWLLYTLRITPVNILGLLLLIGLLLPGQQADEPPRNIWR